MPRPTRYPPVSDYGLVADCHSAALISRTGSIDWCCMPRIDAGSVFGRLLDWEAGGFCEIRPVAAGGARFRRYLDDTLVLETTFRDRGGEARLTDCFAMREGGRRDPRRQLIRVLEGVRGRMTFRIRVAPRFDYGECRPWVRRHGRQLHSAVGGNDGLLVWCDAELQVREKYDVQATIEVAPGDRFRLVITYVSPEVIDERVPIHPDPDEIDKRLEETIAWWRRWSSDGRLDSPFGPQALRSATVLKALTHAPTGAIAAAATTSLPEEIGGARNWDYRFSWIRDSSFAVRSLAELGHEAEAEGFRRFVERSSAGSADELQVLFGPGGERRLTEIELPHLDGYRGSRPVRIGNAAQEQFQLDVYGHLLDLSWRWHERGHSPDDDYWRFLVELVDCAARRWDEPDRGIWEVRGPRRHFVHSKVMCWVALDRGIRLARESQRRAPERRWARARDAIQGAVETRGYDRRRGVFVRSFGSRRVDASLLLLPAVGFVDYRDQRMIRTVDAIRTDLDEGGLIRRYRAADGLEGTEGTFLPCAFWLAECLAYQDRIVEAREVFDRAMSTGNDLGLFAEEYDAQQGTLLGNFPQSLTHLSHIAAAVALTRHGAIDGHES